jgi:hypothetical protein
LVGTKRGKSCKAAAAELTFAIKVIGILIQVVVVYGYFLMLLENQGYFSMKKTPHHTTPHHTLFETLLDFPHSSQLDL